MSRRKLPETFLEGGDRVRGPALCCVQWGQQEARGLPCHHGQQGHGAFQVYGLLFCGCAQHAGPWSRQAAIGCAPGCTRILWARCVAQCAGL